MYNNYVISNEELAVRGLDLNDYSIDGVMINAIIMKAYDICVSRICFLNDNIYGEDGVIEYLERNDEKFTSSSKIKAFKKLQYNMVYNLIYTAEEPIDLYIDTIIVHELRCGKINGIQKGLFYKYNQF